MDYYSANELYHYGVKGMKWGVRRYQNKDGSLTPAGGKRYNGSDYKSRKSNEQTTGNKTSDKIGYGSMSPKDVKKYFNKNGSLTKQGDKQLIDRSGGISHLTLNKEIRKMLGYGDDVTEVQIMSDGSRLLKEKDYPDSDYGYRRIPNISTTERRNHENEFSRRNKLTENESDNELRKILEDNKKAFEDPSYSKEQSESAQKKYLDLVREIDNFSGNWYESYYVSDRNKASSIKRLQLRNREDELKNKCRDMEKAITKKDSWNRNMFDERKLRNNKEYQKVLNDYNTTRAKRKQSENDHLGVVLKDLGYKDTQTARELIEATVYWD